MRNLLPHSKSSTATGGQRASKVKTDGRDLAQNVWRQQVWPRNVNGMGSGGEKNEPPNNESGAENSRVTYGGHPKRKKMTAKKRQSVPD